MVAGIDSTRRLTRSSTIELVETLESSAIASSPDGKIATPSGRDRARRSNSGPTKRKASGNSTSDPLKLAAVLNKFRCRESDDESLSSDDSDPAPSPKRRKNEKKGVVVSAKSPKKGSKVQIVYLDDPLPLDRPPPSLDFSKIIPVGVLEAIPYDLKEGIEYCCSETPYFAKMLQGNPLNRRLLRYFALRSTPDPTPFTTIARAITGQQVSGHAAQAIWHRFLALFGLSESKIDPEDTDIPERAAVDPSEVVKVSAEKLKAVGLSTRKAEYILALAERCATGELNMTEMRKLSADEVRTKLTALKGVGPWTLDMFMMFTMRAPDVFPSGDLAIRRAMSKLYLPESVAAIDSVYMTAKQAEVRAERWKPYRSVAAILLYHCTM